MIGEEGFVSCTPAGVIQLLKRSGIEISGKNCVVVGRSNIVGKPMALLMLRENATVTIAHSKTKNLKELCQTADILIVANGKRFCDHTGSGWSRSNDNCHAYEQLRGKSEQRIRLVEIERVSYEMCKVWS